MLPTDSGAFDPWPKAVDLLASAAEEDAIALEVGLDKVAGGNGNKVVARRNGLPAALAEEERVGDRAVDAEFGSVRLFCDFPGTPKFDSGLVVGVGRDGCVTVVSLCVAWSLCDDSVAGEVTLEFFAVASVGEWDGLEVGRVCCWWALCGCLENSWLDSPLGLSDDFFLPCPTCFGGIQVVMMHTEQCRGLAESGEVNCFAYRVGFDVRMSHDNDCNHWTGRRIAFIAVYQMQPALKVNKA